MAAPGRGEETLESSLAFAKQTIDFLVDYFILFYFILFYFIESFHLVNHNIHGTSPQGLSLFQTFIITQVS